MYIVIGQNAETDFPYYSETGYYLTDKLETVEGRSSAHADRWTASTPIKGTDGKYVIRHEGYTDNPEDVRKGYRDMDIAAPIPDGNDPDILHAAINVHARICLQGSFFGFPDVETYYNKTASRLTGEHIWGNAIVEAADGHQIDEHEAELLSESLKLPLSPEFTKEQRSFASMRSRLIGEPDKIDERMDRILSRQMLDDLTGINLKAEQPPIGMNIPNNAVIIFCTGWDYERGISKLGAIAPPADRNQYPEYDAPDFITRSSIANITESMTINDLSKLFDDPDMDNRELSNAISANKFEVGVVTPESLREGMIADSKGVPKDSILRRYYPECKDADEWARKYRNQDSPADVYNANIYIAKDPEAYSLLQDIIKDIPDKDKPSLLCYRDWKGAYNQFLTVKENADPDVIYEKLGKANFMITDEDIRWGYDPEYDKNGHIRNAVTIPVQEIPLPSPVKITEFIYGKKFGIGVGENAKYGSGLLVRADKMDPSRIDVMGISKEFFSKIPNVSKSPHINGLYAAVMRAEDFMKLPMNGIACITMDKNAQDIFRERNLHSDILPPRILLDHELQHVLSSNDFIYGLDTDHCDPEKGAAMRKTAEQIEEYYGFDSSIETAQQDFERRFPEVVEKYRNLETEHEETLERE